MHAVLSSFYSNLYLFNFGCALGTDFESKGDKLSFSGASRIRTQASQAPTCQQNKSPLTLWLSYRRSIKKIVYVYFASGSDVTQFSFLVHSVTLTVWLRTSVCIRCIPIHFRLYMCMDVNRFTSGVCLYLSSFIDAPLFISGVWLLLVYIRCITLLIYFRLYMLMDVQPVYVRCMVTYFH